MSKARRRAAGGRQPESSVSDLWPAASGSAFAEPLLSWFDAHGRKNLPWQRTPTPYRVWVSEIMLQQTQVATVIGYYDRFIGRLPDVASLAAAPLDTVLHLWSGLGYYARARNLHKAAALIMTQHHGVFPESLAQVQSLPGIGRSTAGAILSLSLGQRHPILDGNVKRVLTRFAGIEGFPGNKPIETRLWQLAEQLMPVERPAAYTQAIMDLGATLCVRSRPLCKDCPLATACVAHAHGWQDRLPTPKPRKARVQKSAHAVIAVEPGGAVLLERRPASGIWGGLWSFPQFDNEADAALFLSRLRGKSAATSDLQPAACSLQLKSDVAPAPSPQPPAEAPAISRWPACHHAFTHFDLALHPWVARNVVAGTAVAEIDRYRWYDPVKPEEVGLATPVAELMRAVTASVEGS